MLSITGIPFVGTCVRGRQQLSPIIPCWIGRELSNNIIQKRLAFARQQSGTVVNWR
jgi:hypothetical protein